jgi:hypothetical protein
MKTNSPLETFKPFFCPAHTKPGDMNNIIVQLAAPYQFVAIATILAREGGPPQVVIDCYWNNPLPDAQHKLIADRLYVALLKSIESFYPEMDPNAEYQVSDNQAHTCTLGPGFRFLWCESQEFGATHDTVLYPGPSWTLYALDYPSEGELRIAYTEEPTNPLLEELLIQDSEPDSRPKSTEALQWYQSFIQNLSAITAENLAE